MPKIALCTAHGLLYRCGGAELILRTTCLGIVITAGLTAIAPLRAGHDITQPASERTEVQAPPTFADAQRLFYNARYEAAAGAALTL